MTTSYISADPYLRGRIKSSGGMKDGDAMVGFTAGKITASKHPKVQPPPPTQLITLITLDFHISFVTIMKHFAPQTNMDSFMTVLCLFNDMTIQV